MQREIGRKIINPVIDRMTRVLEYCFITFELELIPGSFGVRELQPLS